MDLRHARTFVTVAELGTVSEAAVRLRIAQPALSRQISNLEQEFGLKLFDRVGRRLVLTGEGEQLLSDCRVLLNYASALGEHAQLLRRGDAGVLKVAASPQFIEGVMSDFLRRYAQRYPNVQVKLIEAIAWSDTLGMLERGEIHLGQNLLRAVQSGDPRFANHPLEMVELLAASHAPLMLGKNGTIEIFRLAAHPLLVLDTSFVSRRTFDATCRLAGIADQYRLREPDTAYPAGNGREGTRRSHRPFCGAHRSVPAPHRPSDLPGQTVARALGHLLGQAAPLAALRRSLLRDAGGVRARSVPDFAAVRAQARRHGAASGDAPARETGSPVTFLAGAVIHIALISFPLQSSDRLWPKADIDRLRRHPALPRDREPR